MRRIVRVIATTAAAIAVSVTGLIGPTAAPARASNPPPVVLWAYGAEDPPCCLGLYFLHAHAHNAPVDVTGNAGLQDWQLVHPVNVGNLSGQQQVAWQIQLVGNGECLNDVPSQDDTIYLDSCVAGDMNEYFWPTFLGTPEGTDDYWFINVATSGNAGAYRYMTADLFLGSLGTSVQDLPAGYGAAAVWGLG